MSRVTALVITHNSAEVVDACLASCGALDALVVDNGSSDDTVQRVSGHPRARLLANVENRGFAGAANQGFREAGGDYVLLLNPDARLDAGLDLLIELMDGDPQCAIAAGVLTDAAGAVQRGFTARRFPRALTLVFEALGLNRIAPWNPVNRTYRYLDRNFTEACEVD